MGCVWQHQAKQKFSFSSVLIWEGAFAIKEAVGSSSTSYSAKYKNNLLNANQDDLRTPPVAVVDPMSNNWGAFFHLGWFVTKRLVREQRITTLLLTAASTWNVRRVCVRTQQKVDRLPLPLDFTSSFHSPITVKVRILSRKSRRSKGASIGARISVI